jgi:hypothetical protein
MILMTFAVSFVQAQATRPHRSPVLDLTLGSHNVSGATFANSNGLFLDLFAAGSLRSTPKRALVAGLGVTGIASGFGDVCRFRPDGSCAPRANFVATSMLAGFGVPLGEASGRVLVGPTLYKGEDDTSLGLQARLDVSSPTLAHFGFGGMVRASVIPSYAGDRFYSGSMGLSLFVR